MAESTSTYKWELVGGAPWVLNPSGNATTTSTGWSDITSGPSLTLPRAGDYLIRYGIEAGCSVFTSTYFAQFVLSVGGTQYGSSQLGCPLAWAMAAMASEQLVTGLAASAFVKLQVQNDRDGGGTTTWSVAWLDVAPKRVS